MDELMDKTKVSSEKKLTLLLLCWLFGLFGIHRLYTGKYLTAAIQLFTWVLAGILSLTKNETLPYIPIGFLFLWWIIDVMRIIIGKFTDKEGKAIIDWV
jgi:TM2 domain-containing membrane protein YozV